MCVWSDIPAVQDYEMHYMNAWLKRCVFNLDLNRESVSEPRTLSGRLFRSLGARYENGFHIKMALWLVLWSRVTFGYLFSFSLSYSLLPSCGQLLLDICKLPRCWFSFSERYNNTFSRFLNVYIFYVKMLFFFCCYIYQGPYLLSLYDSNRMLYCSVQVKRFCYFNNLISLR